MRKLVAITQVTLDGVMQAPGGPEEDPSGGFAHGGWSVTYFDDALGAHLDEAMSGEFELVLGRSTYEIFAAHWPFSGDETGAALTAATKHVASTTLGELSWANSRLLGDDVPGAVAALKAQDGPDLHVHGSATLLQTLIAHGLVDEFRMFVFPVVVGGGKRLFGADAPALGLELVSSSTTATGVTAAVYRAAGALETGSFAFEEPTDLEVERRARAT